MLVPVLALVLPLQQAAATDLPEFREHAVATLLEGGVLPTDYRRDLMEMSPAERIEAIIFLRRSGLLTGKPWLIDDLLSPVAGEPVADSAEHQE